MAKLPDIQPYIDELPYDAKTKDALFKAFYDADPFAALGGVADVPKQVKQVIFNIRGKAEQGQPFDLKDISRFAATAPPPVAKEAKPVSEKVVTITKSSKPKAAPEEPPKEQVDPPDLASESLPSRPLIQPSDSAVEGVPFSEYTPASYVPTGTVRPTLDYQSEEALAEVPSLSTRYGVVRKPAPKEGRPVAAKPAAPQAPAPVASKSTAPPPIMPSIPPGKAQLEEVDAPSLLKDVARGFDRGLISTVASAAQALTRIPGGLRDQLTGLEIGLARGRREEPIQYEGDRVAPSKTGQIARERVIRGMRKQEESLKPPQPISGVGKFTEAASSSVPYLAVGAVFGKRGTATLGALNATEEALRRLEDSGVSLTDNQKAGVVAAAALLGTTESLPIERLFNRLKAVGAVNQSVSAKGMLEALFPSLKDLAKSGSKQFLAEGSQEWFAEIGQDVIQTLYGGRKLGDIGENAKEAFTTGGEVGVVLDLLTKLLGTRAGRARLRKSGVEPKEFKQFLEQDESKEFTDQQAAVDEFLKSKASAAEAAPEGEASLGTEEVVAAPAGPKSFIDEYNEDPEKVYGDLIGEIAKKQEKIDRLSKYKSNKNQVKKLQKELSILNRRKSSLDRLRSAEAEPTEEIELESPPEIPGETPALPTVEATPAPPAVPESPKPVTAPEKPVAFSTPSGTKVVDLTNNPPADKGIVAGQDYDPATDSLFNVDELGLYAVLKSREQPGSYEIWSMDDPSGPVSVVQAKDTKEAFSGFIDARPAEIEVAPPVTAEGVTEPPPIVATPELPAPPAAAAPPPAPPPTTPAPQPAPAPPTIPTPPTAVAPPSPPPVPAPPVAAAPPAPAPSQPAPPPSQPAPVPEKPETAPQAPPVSPKPPAAVAPPTAPAPKPKTKDSEESGPVELSIKHQVGSGSGQIISKDVLVRFPNSVDVDAFRVVDSAFKKRASGEEKRQATRVEEAIAKASGVTDKTEILKILAAYRESINKLSKEIAIVEADLGELSGFEAPSIQDFSKEFVSPKRYPAISYEGKDFSPYGIYNKGTDANPIYAIGELADNGMVKSRWDDETFESVTQAAYFANRKANESPKATAAPVPTSAPPTPTPAESTPEPPVTPLEPGGGPVTVKEKAPKQVEPSEKEIQQEEKALEFAPLSDLPKRSVRISSTTEEGSQPRYTATHNGETWHTNAQVLVKGDPPGYWKPETIEQREFNLKGIIPDASTRVSEVEPMAYKHRTKLKDGSKKNELVDDEFIIMSDGGSISGDYYRYVLNKVAPDQWKTPGDDRYIAYKKGKPVAIVMRIRNANNAKYNKESVAMSLKERKDIREKELWEMSKEELQKRHALNRDNPKYKKGTEEHDTHDKIVAEAVLSGKPVPEYVVEGMGTGFRWVSDTILQRLLYREKLKAASERGEEVGAYKLYHEAEEKVKPIVLDYLERVREGENPGDIYEFVKSKLEPGPNPPGFTPEPPEIPKQEPKDKPVESPELPESPKATAAPTPPSVPPPSKPKAEPASVKEDVAKLDDEFPHLKGAFKKKEGKPTAKPKMPPATTPPNKAISPNDINEVSVSPEGEIELSYQGKGYQAIPLFGSTKGFRFYDLKTGAEMGEIKGKGDAAEALAELLNKQVETPAVKSESEKPAQKKIPTKYIEPRTPQYRKDDNLIALKLRSDRNPVIWMNQRAKLNVFEALERNGVRGFHPTSLGTNFNKASNFYSLLDAVLAKPVGMFKGSQKQRDLLVALRDAMQEARQFSVLNGKDGGVSLINVDSPGREVLVSPESYKAFESKPESVKSFHRIFKVGAVGDLIKTFRHENVHAEMSTAVKSIPKADIDTLFKNPSIVEFSSILQRKGYSGADPYTVINELTAHVLTGDFDFFSSNGMTPESLVNAYSVVRPYILAIDKDAVVRGERFKRPGLKVSESDPAKLSGTSEQQTAKPNSNEVTGAMLSTQPPPFLKETAPGRLSRQESNFPVSYPITKENSIEVSTRVPKSKKSTENAIDNILTIGYDAIAMDKNTLSKIVERMKRAKSPKKDTSLNRLLDEKNYSNSIRKRIYSAFESRDPLESLMSIDELSRDDKDEIFQSRGVYVGLSGLDLSKDPEEAARQIMERMTDNLLWLYDKFPKEWSERAKVWYEGANKIASEMSVRYNISKGQSSGVLAVLSPGKDWFENAEMAETTMDLYSKRDSLKWSDEMNQFLNREFSKREGSRNSADVNVVEAIDRIRGKSFNQLTSDFDKAIWLRTYDETGDRARQFRIITPEGEYAGIKLKNNGQPAKYAWQPYDDIAKAISILENGSQENISDKLGTAHKVRNFYNNIISPSSKLGHVTADTHAVGAGLLQEVSQKSTEVSQNFSTPNSSITGTKGSYGLLADAVRKAAAGRSTAESRILPREMQSITWEAARLLFSVKSNATKNAVINAWLKFENDPSQGIDKVREEIYTLSKGFDEPDWLSTKPTGKSGRKNNETQ